jgi:4-hydroxythreonine-4-phosphate dehydrogenase
MAAPAIVILADDLTGAADSAGAFAAAGLVTAIPLCDAPTPSADVLAVSSECRDVAECDVEARNRVALARARAAGAPRLWYRKIDSVLRGHPGLEIALTMQALGLQRAICAPALPAEGRVTRDARVYVHGLPLHTMTLGVGVRTSFIVDHFRQAVTGRIGVVHLDTVRRGEEALAAGIDAFSDALVIIDAETDADLGTIARVAVALRETLLVGSAGLASAMRCVLPAGPGAPSPPPIRRTGRPTLAIAGSRHEATARQIDRAAGAGVPVVAPSTIEDLSDPARFAELQEAIASRLVAGSDVIVTTAGCPPSSLPGHLIAEHLARLAAVPCRKGLVGGLFLTGGDVAAAVCETLGVDFLWLRGEVTPAIPWGDLGSGPLANLPIVTKAGSFGPPDVLLRSIALLHAVAAGPS